MCPPSQLCREDHEPKQLRAPLQPEIPDRPQQRGEQPEEQHAASQRPQQDEPPQPALRLTQSKEEQRRDHRQTVQQIQRGGEPGMPMPDGPQQVVQHPGGQPQQDGKAKNTELGRDRKGHAIRTGG